MSIPSFPADLQAIIAARRARFAPGMTMTAESPGEQGAESAGDGQPAAASAPTPPAAPPAAPPADWDGKVDSLPQGVQDLIKNLRAENGASRVRAKDAAEQANAKMLAGLKAMQDAGLIPATIQLGNDDDPVKVAQQAAEEQRVAADTARAEVVLSRAELIVWRASQELGVNAAAVNDSRAFAAAVQGLDPNADDFDQKVRAAATAAANANSSLKTSPGGTGRGGSPFNGGTGEGKKASEFGSLHDAVAATYTD